MALLESLALTSLILELPQTVLPKDLLKLQITLMFALLIGLLAV